GRGQQVRGGPGGAALRRRRFGFPDRPRCLSNFAGRPGPAGDQPHACRHVAGDDLQGTGRWLGDCSGTMKDAPARPLIPRRQVLVAMSAVMLPAAAQNAERRVEVSLLPDGAVRSFEDAISDFEAVSYVVPLVAGQTLQVVLAS